jgi:hypothetical protein
MDQESANLENASLRTSRKDKEKNCKESKLNLGCFKIHVHRYIPDLPSCSEILTRSEPPTTPTVTTCTQKRSNNQVKLSHSYTLTYSNTESFPKLQSTHMHKHTHSTKSQSRVCVCEREREGERERARIQLSNEMVI